MRSAEWRSKRLGESVDMATRRARGLLERYAEMVRESGGQVTTVDLPWTATDRMTTKYSVYRANW